MAAASFDGRGLDSEYKMESGRWNRIEAIFHEAAELTHDQRTALLERTCGNDPEMRREVESLLSAEQHGGILRSVIAEAVERLPAERDENSSLIGSRIGAYLITGLIGRGGMGAVYRATREDDFRMVVAIKLLKWGGDRQTALARFLTERQILARLQHSNIARLFDGGATESGLPYFVMEYVDGKPLLEYAAPLPLRRRLELFCSVCRTVQYAHETLIVHRDIKPSNILITREGIPKLLDFGIAKLLDPPAEGITAAVTAAGGPLMTPGYASPEQVCGRPVTIATDIYSLGAVLYELMTSRPAHVLQNYSLEEIQREICTREPEKPSALAGDLNPDLDNIALTALRKEPERRYSSAAGLCDDVERYLQDRPVQARGESILYRGPKFFKR